MGVRFPLPFSPDYEFAAAKPFTLNGIRYNPGEKIDKTGLSRPRLQAMYLGRQISPIIPITASVPAPHPAEEATQPVADVSDPPFLPPAGSDRKLSVKHIGGGRYAVVADGKDILSTHASRAEAAVSLANQGG